MDTNFEQYEEEKYFKSLVKRFEEMLKKNEQYFFDVDEFEIIIDYYFEKENLKRTDEAIQYAIAQYPNNTTFLLKKAQFLRHQIKHKKLWIFSLKLKI
ncbi:MAG: hypothetical protein K8R58_01995 [Bacteroidales bacterium]|nr:hypothetical protein [Bacteroidales bacterium]